MGGGRREHKCAGSKGLGASDLSLSFLAVTVKRIYSHLQNFILEKEGYLFLKERNTFFGYEIFCLAFLI